MPKLSDLEFFNWYRTLRLSKEAREVIQGIRRSGPSRLVKNTRSNVPGRYPSEKNQETRQFESHTVELPFVYELEHDPAVLEYYDQPPKIQLSYLAPNGRPVRADHTPDFFVIGQDSAGWFECKSEDDLVELAKQMPGRYQKIDGRWHCPPGENHASTHGLYYRVRSSAEASPLLARNFEFLADYLGADCPDPTPDGAEAIRSIVAAQPGITLYQLAEEAKAEGATADEVNILIARRELHVDLLAAPLAEPELVPVYPDEDSLALRESAQETSLVLAEGGSPAMAWRGKIWMTADVSETVTLLADDGQVSTLSEAEFANLLDTEQIKVLDSKSLPGATPEGLAILHSASPSDFAVANERYRVIAPYLDGYRREGETIPERTVRRWVGWWRSAEKTYGGGYIGLLPRLARSGNRQRRVEPETLMAMEAFIETFYEDVVARGVSPVWGMFLAACETDEFKQYGIRKVSYDVFLDAVHSRAGHGQTLKRKGRRAAYAQKPFCWHLEQSTPRHGDRPFHLAHIDHTQLEIELLASRKPRRNMGRPWATFLVDACSRRLLAIWISYDPPSYRSCMMALRICVLRHKRLPQAIVVDGGAEFRSIYFETFCARHRITKLERPSAEARFGSVIERLFGTSQSDLIHNLLGNTKVMRRVREVTRSVNPKRLAVWPTGLFYQAICEWGYETYDESSHPALRQSPRQAFLEGLAETGERKHKFIAYDEDFRLSTLPTTPRGKAKVDMSRGVKINTFWYWCDDLANPDIAGTDVPVRFDPFDAGEAWAYIQKRKRWAKCLSQEYYALKGRSQRQIQIASEELQKQQKDHRKQRELRATDIGRILLQAANTEGELQRQILRDAENQVVLKIVEGGRADSALEVVEPDGNSVGERSVPAESPRSPAVAETDDSFEREYLEDYA